MMNTRERDVLIAQLFAARAQIDATLAVLGVPLEGDVVDTAESGGPCQHPPESVEDVSTFGAEEYRCNLCGELSAKPFNSVEE